MSLRFSTFTFWNCYVLKLLRLETITFSDAPLSDINVVLCYVLSQYRYFRYLRGCVVSCDSDGCNTAPCLLPLNQLLPLVLLLLYTSSCSSSDTWETVWWAVPVSGATQPPTSCPSTIPLCPTPDQWYFPSCTQHKCYRMCILLNVAAHNVRIQNVKVSKREHCLMYSVTKRTASQHVKCTLRKHYKMFCNGICFVTLYVMWRLCFENFTFWISYVVCSYVL